MSQPARDPEHPSHIWVPPHACEHPRKALTFIGSFPPENVNLSVFTANCYKCGSEWTQADLNAPWDQLSLKIAYGEFGVVSAADPEIEHKVEWNRQTRYDAIMRDVAGENNPILSSDVPLKRPD
jgi:hypothetical protein